MVSQRETDVRIYDGLVAFAARTGDEALAGRLRELGRPPYNDVLRMLS